MRHSNIRRALGFVLALGLIAGGSAAVAQTVQKPVEATSARRVQIPIQQVTLKIGLRIVLSEDHAAPTVSLCITFDVGSRNELPGHTGFAHLFEHMMFQSSHNVAKCEHMILLQDNGCDVSGTSNDHGAIYCRLTPSKQLRI